MQDWIRKLERAKALLDEGALTLEEFETEKARLLAASALAYATKEERTAKYDLNENRVVRSTARVKIVVMVVTSILVAIVAYFLLAKHASRPPTVPAVVEPRQSAAAVPAAIPTLASQAVTNRTASQPATPSPTAKVAKKADEPAAWTITEQALIERWSELNELCRGGSGDDPSTMEACDLREEVSGQLASADICFGKSGQYGYQMGMHRCNERSLSRQ